MTIELRADYSRHIVCVFNRGPKITYFLGIDGPQLTTLQMPHDQFDRLYYHVPRHDNGDPYTPNEFAVAYMRDDAARKMIPLSASAVRVLVSIIKGQPLEAGDLSPHLENAMASAQSEAGFRRPDGPVAQVHKFLDGKVDQIKAGTVSRKELLDKMVEKGISIGTATTQCGIWARNNGISFVRPTQAAETKKTARSKAAKKAAKGKAPAKKAATPRKPRAKKAAEAAPAEAAAS